MAKCSVLVIQSLAAFDCIQKEDHATFDCKPRVLEVPLVGMRSILCKLSACTIEFSLRTRDKVCSCCRKWTSVKLQVVAPIDVK